MKNLKRVLSLALAGTMLSGMMVIGASAADFTDSDKIEHTDAVNTLVALNVINGKDDGSYDPTGIVTRAEMAKLITVALNGGKDPVLGTKAVPTYTDIDNHWAESYIEYCSNLKIINGRGDGTFDPNGTVTGIEAAKMMLVAMGWDSTIFNFTGADWALNVGVEANKVELFDELEDIDPSMGLTRDDTAQLIFNGILAPMMVKNPNMTITNGEITWNYHLDESVSIFTEKFKGVKHEGILTYDGLDDGVYTYTVTGVTTDKNGKVVDDVLTVEVEEDHTDLFQMNVEVLYKRDAKDDLDKVYGIYAKDNNILATGIIADLAKSGSKIKVGSTKYNLTNGLSGTEMIEFLVDEAMETLDEVETYTKGDDATVLPYDIKLIDNDNDKKGDVVVVYPFTVEKVTYVGTKSFTAGKPYDFDEVNTYEDMEEGDWVKITAAANTADDKASFEKLELIEDTAEAVKKTDNRIKFSGEWLNTKIVGTENVDAGADCEYIAVNGYLFHLDATSIKKGAEDFVLVTAAADNTSGKHNTQEVDLLKADGTVVAAKVSKVYNATKGDFVKVTSSNKAEVGGLYIYEMDDNDNYKLTEVSDIVADETEYENISNDEKILDYVKDDGKKGQIIVDNKNNKAYIDDNAVVFVDKGDDKYAVTTGAALKDSSATAVTEVRFVGYNTKSSNGYDYIELVYVASSKLGKTTDSYAYVTGDVVKYKENGKYYVEIPVGDDTLVTTSDSDVVARAYKLKAGDVFKYEMNGDGKVTIGADDVFDMPIMADGEPDFHAALIGREGDDVRLSSNIFTAKDKANDGDIGDYVLTDDTVIIYVVESDNEIVKGGKIRLADTDALNGNKDDERYYANVKVVLDKSDNDKKEIAVLVVDVDNDILGIRK